MNNLSNSLKCSPSLLFAVILTLAAVASTMSNIANAIPVFNVGRVVTAAGDPVPGAVVHFHFGNDEGDRLPAEGEFEATTDEHGVFAFYNSNPDDTTLFEFKRGTVEQTDTTKATPFDAAVGLEPDLRGALDAAGFTPGLIDIILALLAELSGIEIPVILSTDFVMQGCVECVEAALKSREGENFILLSDGIPCPISEPSTLMLLAGALIYGGGFLLIRRGRKAIRRAKK